MQYCLYLLSKAAIHAVSNGLSRTPPELRSVNDRARRTNVLDALASQNAQPHSVGDELSQVDLLVVMPRQTIKL